jgi:hypothetical protein
MGKVGGKISAAAIGGTSSLDCLKLGVKSSAAAATQIPRRNLAVGINTFPSNMV